MRTVYIHDDITHGIKDGWRLSFSKEIGEIVDGVDVGNLELEILDALANEKMPPLDVFDLLMVSVHNFPG